MIYKSELKRIQNYQDLFTTGRAEWVYTDFIKRVDGEWQVVPELLQKRVDKDMVYLRRYEFAFNIKRQMKIDFLLSAQTVFAHDRSHFFASKTDCGGLKEFRRVEQEFAEQMDEFATKIDVARQYILKLNRE